MRRRLGNLAWAWILPALLFSSSASLHAQAGHAPATSGMEREFQAAMAAEDRGDLQQAESLLTTLHNQHPGIFAVDESLGLLIASRGDAARALPLLQEAVHEQPSSDAAHANLGAALYALHRNQSALHEFLDAVHINPRNFSAQQSLGRLWMDDHKPDEAAKAFQAALQLRPQDTDLQLDCVTALLAANHVDEAKQVLSAFPEASQSARAQSLLAQIDEKQGRFNSAGEHFARAAQLDPSEENAWQMGYELLRHWTFEPAIVEFQAASARFPNSKRLRLGLGAALYGAAQYARAIPVFAGLLQNDPENAMDAELLGISCNAVVETSSPLCGALVTYAQMHPNDATAATYAATWLMTNQQRLDLARKLLERSIAANPNLPEAQFQMGVLLQNNLDWKGSIPYLVRAVKLKPDFAQAHYRLARAYWRTGRKQEGREQMELQQKYARQESQDLDRRLRQITRFAVNVQP